MQIWNPAASFTRPNDTTAYTAGDLIANSTTAGSVVPMSFALGGNNNPGLTRITRARMSKTSTTVTAASFRLHLYQTSPTVTNGDNGAFTSNQAANYLGNINIDMTTTPGAKFSDGANGQGAAAAGSEMQLRLASGTTIFGLIEAIGAYVPTALEVFTVTLESVEAY